MKRIVYILLMAVATLSASAQEFRGILDLYGGISPSKGYDAGIVSGEKFSDIRPIVAFGMNIAEGYQINKMFFAGIGVGGYTVIDHFRVKDINENYGYGETHFPAIMLPVFADLRWTLDIGKTVTPFVDLKIGYQFQVALSDGEISWSYGDEDNLYLRQIAGFYFQPTVGLRFGKASAFNLGITFNPTINQKIYRGVDGNVATPFKDLKSGALMLSLGADF